MEKENTQGTKNDHDQGTVILEWSFPEFETYTRGTGWYVGAGGITLALIVYAIWTLNFLFAVMVLMVVVILFFHTIRPPLMVAFKMTEYGIHVGRHFYPYREIKNFWIIYQPPDVKNLYFIFQTFVRPRLSIPLMNRNPLKVRELLLQYLPEDIDRESEPTSETLSRWLKL